MVKSGELNDLSLLDLVLVLCTMSVNIFFPKIDLIFLPFRFGLKGKISVRDKVGKE